MSRTRSRAAAKQQQQQQQQQQEHDSDDISTSGSLALTKNLNPSAALSVPVPKQVARSVPAFLNKLFSMVNDPATDELIRWSEAGDSFFVPSADRVGRELLPRFFKHSNFGSFVRQLNMYGFHKVPHLQQGVLKNDSEEANELLEFSNPSFLRNQPDLLCLIRRQKARTDAPLTTTSSGETSLDLPTLLTDLAAIRKHQTALSADLKDLQTSNHALWQEALQSRERHTRHQETINKILRFLATVFGSQVAAEETDSGTVLEEEVEADGENKEGNNGKGKGKARQDSGTQGMNLPGMGQMRSRLLLEDVKGRKEAREKKRMEEEIFDLDEEEDRMDDDEEEIEEIHSGGAAPNEEMEDLPTISSASRYNRPTMMRSGSNNGTNSFGFPSNNSSSSSNAADALESRFTTIPSASTSPSMTDPLSPATQAHQAGLPPDVLSSLLSPSNTNTLAAFLQLQNGGGLNTATVPGVGLPTASTSNTTSDPMFSNSYSPSQHYPLSLLDSPTSQSHPQASTALPPSSLAYSLPKPAQTQHQTQQLASLIPTLFASDNNSTALSDDYTQAINDHNQALRDVTAEKEDIDRRQTQLEAAIANLMNALPPETREQLMTGAGTEGAGTVNGNGGAGMQWPTTGEFGTGMADADLEKLLAQYANDESALHPTSLASPNANAHPHPNSVPQDYSYLFDPDSALGSHAHQIAPLPTSIGAPSFDEEIGRIASASVSPESSTAGEGEEGSGSGRKRKNVEGGKEARKTSRRRS